MTTLKNKIKIVPPLPSDMKEKKKISPIKILVSILLCGIVITSAIIVYNHLIPYINAVNIKNIVGKKINYTDCNTKDYLIINKDKSYSMQLTNNDCEISHYEGDIIIKNNEITFKYKEKKAIKGYIDIKNYNIEINNNMFVSESNE